MKRIMYIRGYRSDINDISEYINLFSYPNIASNQLIWTESGLEKLIVFFLSFESSFQPITVTSTGY